jgi:ABC-type transport system involved in cytochrome c biogenesis permease component
MTFLPIVDRELRLAARSPGLYKARIRTALIAILFTAWAFFSLSAFSRMGLLRSHDLFAQFVFYVFLFCSLAGPHHTADCLSVEKREGTLGLLFLTDLKGYDVVLGKLMASSLASFYGLLAVFPVVAILMTMGGVLPGEFFRLALLLLNTLLFSHSVSMFASALSSDARRAKGLATALVGLFWVVLPAAEAVLRLRPSPHWLHTALLLPSPYHAFKMAFDSALVTRQSHFWWPLLVNHLVAWGFLLWAGWMLPRVWQDKGVTVQRMKWRERWAQWCYGRAEKRRAWRLQLMDKNPFLWLISRNRLRPYWIWFLLSCVFALFSFFFILVSTKPGWSPAATGIAIWGAIIMNSMIKLWIAGEASTYFATYRRDGSLEWLLSTPLNVADIIRGQWLAVQRLLGGPAFAVLIADFLMLVLGVAGMAPAQRWDEDMAAFVLAMLAGIGMLVADAITLGWTGMWSGLSAPQVRQASGNAITHVLVFPWLIYGFASAFTGLTIEYGWIKPLGAFYWIGLWFFIGIVNDIFWGVWSRHKLYTDFRLLCAPPEDRRKRRWWEFWKPKPLDNPRWVTPG